MPVVPVSDVIACQRATYQRGERLVQWKPASFYHLIEIFGWNRRISDDITARVTRDEDGHLNNPLGLLYHEIIASSLPKVTLNGTIAERGTIGLGVDKRGQMLHAAVHEAHPDVRCVVHLNTPATITVSCTKTGLLPVSQVSLTIGETVLYDL
ncbi:Alpha-adducin [Fasciolopsis buskii]|uniref:Alpha-adducin n=1 Tax=Fasciolopsis buskii TaxID=27845 RepID=A0A8E0RQG2_9TREM|nr:Alpha-adducin [Fasciolopsis buski]